MSIDDYNYWNDSRVRNATDTPETFGYIIGNDIATPDMSIELHEDLFVIFYRKDNKYFYVDLENLKDTIEPGLEYLGVLSYMGHSFASELETAGSYWKELLELNRSVLENLPFNSAFVGKYKPYLRTKNVVCPQCDGKGTMVNPSVDAGGISEFEFAQDPEFRRAYFSGVYDVTCSQCKGKRIVSVIDHVYRTVYVHGDAYPNKSFENYFNNVFFEAWESVLDHARMSAWSDESERAYERSLGC